MSLVSGPGRASATGLHNTGDDLVVAKHVKYIQNLDKRKDELEYWLTEHLRLNGVYWGLTALHLLGHPDALPRNETVDFVLSCQQTNGGFGAAPGHDTHMLYTVSAVQILVTVDALDELDQRGKAAKAQVVDCEERLYICIEAKLTRDADIASLQQDTGEFCGDEWGETDTRFLFGALLALSLLGELSAIDLEKAVAVVQACQNLDGGYGTRPGAESHSGQIYTCVGALSIAGRLDLVDRDRLGGWLSERQLEDGGLNGRPEKLEDVCYSWWVMSSMAMIDRLHWVDANKLKSYILRCQDIAEGGFADRPGNMVDVFHTVFGLAGLSLLSYPGLEPVSPLYCMPEKLIRKLFPS